MLRELQAGWGNYFWCVNFGDPRAAIARRTRDPAAAAAGFGKRINDEAGAALLKQINREREAARLVLLKSDETLRPARPPL